MDYTKLEKQLNYEFKDKGLLERALTHSSYAHEKTGNQINGNERLEFIGDAVLGARVGTYLYGRLPESPEGQLTKIRAAIVCERALFNVAKELELGAYLLLDRGEELRGGMNNPSINADAMEAVFGAIFLDGGYEEAGRVILGLLDDTIEEAIGGKLPKDSKSELQEYYQAMGKTDLVYRVVEESGPAHDKIFTVEVSEAGICLGRGSGRSKKAAEFAAADMALIKIKG